MSHPVTRVNAVETLVVGAVAFGVGAVAAVWLGRRNAGALEQVAARLGERAIRLALDIRPRTLPEG